MVSPKIILNEDYLDLRKCPENSLNSGRSNTGTYTSHQKGGSSVNNSNLKSDGLRLEKELINCGLKRLVSSYNASTGPSCIQKQVGSRRKVHQKEKPKYDPRFRRFLVPEEKTCLKSQSEISIAPKILQEPVTMSTPLFPREKTPSVEADSSRNAYDSYKNKFTMTSDSQDRTFKRKPLELSSDGPLSASAPYTKEISKGFPPLRTEYTVNQQSIDPRLCEKYSVLKMPWKRTWTIPVFSYRSSTLNSVRALDHTDRRTYLYDDGTDVDSTYIDRKQKQLFGNVFQSQFMAVLFLGGSVCGILLVSLLVWFIFGFDVFRIFFKPRDIPDKSLKWYLKYLSGGMIYIVANFFKIIGRILVTPTQQVYHAPPERYRWPPIHHQVPRE